MFQLRMRMKEMREIIMRKWDLREFHVLVNCTIPNTAGKSPNPACDNTDTRSSKPSQVIHAPDFLYPLVSAISSSSSSPISLFLIHNSTIVAEHKAKSSLCISPCHDYELTPSGSIHRVQYTPSTVYTYN